MRTVVGIFTSQAAAERAAEHLYQLGIAWEQINCLIPGDSPPQTPSSPGWGQPLVVSWVGLRDAEAATYTAQGWDFTL